MVMLLNRDETLPIDFSKTLSVALIVPQYRNHVIAKKRRNR